MNKIKYFLFLLISFQLSCTGTGVNPKKLVPYSTGKVITISSDLIYIKNDIAGYNFTYTLKSGKYSPKYRNEKGIYYEGIGKCLSELGYKAVIELHPPIVAPSLTECGIYIEHKDPKNPKIYYYLNPEVQPYGALKNHGLLISAMHDAEIKARLDNIHIHVFQPEPSVLYNAIKFE